MKQQIQNRTLFINDNLNVLRGMNSESVDLIYIDPPFNSNRTYEAPIGSVAEGAKFKDVWYLDDIEQEWIDSIEVQNTALYNLLETIGTMGHSREANGNKGYLQYMSIRLLEMHRILKPTGSIYLHCDTKMSHYLKMVMDCIFLPRRFRNEIVWSYRTGGASKKQFSKKHDVILFYARHRKQYNFNPQTEKAYTKAKGRRAGKVVYGNENGKERSSMFYEDEQGVYTNVVMRDVWDIPYINSQAKERTGYPTQKPLALLERIIQASSNEGDMVLDAFCGCATTLIACEKLNRQWIGIDISQKAVELVNKRMKDESNNAESNILEWGQGKYQTIVRTDLPVRTDKEQVVINTKAKQQLYKEQKGICNGCEEHFDMIQRFEIDHKTPRSKGGGDNIENLQLLCGLCNRVKGDRDMHYLKVRIKEIKKGNIY